MDFESCSDDLSFYGFDSSSEEDSDSSCDDELSNALNPSFTKALNLPKRSSSEEDSDSSCDNELSNALNPSFTEDLNLPKRSVDLEMGSKRILPRLTEPAPRERKAFVVSDQLDKCKKSNEPRKPVASKHDLKEKKEKHVMLSYCHENKKMVYQIKDELQKSGYKTWIDIEDCPHNLLDALCKAVKTSAVILLCMSTAYGKSKSCRDEAECARKYLDRDDIIPLIVEKEFKLADCVWLDFLVGSRFYHDVAEEYNEQSHNRLIKQIGDRGKRAIVFKDEEESFKNKNRSSDL